MAHNHTEPIEHPDVIAQRRRQIVEFCAKHWLALVLMSLLLFTSVPFLAPIAMAAGWTQVGNAIYSFYSFFCHQLPQRSWFLFGEKLTYTLPELQQLEPANSAWALRSFVGTPQLGWKVAWSDRMISFYFMTPVFGILFAFIRATGRRIKPISWIVVGILLAPLVADGATHALSDVLAGMTGSGFRDSNTWLAALTANAFPEFYAGDHFGTFNWWTRLWTGTVAAWALAFFTFPWLDRFFEQEFQSP